jgi:hypothetical protein
MPATMMVYRRVLVVATVLVSLFQFAAGGPLSLAAVAPYVGTCYTACNVGYGTCLSLSGLTAGVVGPVGWVAWLTSAPAACSLAQGTCMAACSAAGAAGAVLVPI